MRYALRSAWRDVARSPKSYVVVGALVFLATAALVLTLSAGWMATRTPLSPYGPGTSQIVLVSSDKQSLDDGIRAGTRAFLNAVVVRGGSIRFASRASQLPISDESTSGVLGGHSRSILRGRAPAHPQDVVVPEGVLDLLRQLLGPSTDLGSAIDLGNGSLATITGVVRNPADYGDVTVLASRGTRFATESATLYVRASESEVADFASRNPSVLAAGTTARPTSPGRLAISVAASIGVLAIALLIGAFAFSVSASRRLRDFGILGAVGATSGQVGLRAVAVGSVCGVAGSVPGALAGYALAAQSMSGFERVLGHDIAAASPALFVPVFAVLLMTLVTTLAALFPARRIARLPIVSALNGVLSELRPGGGRKPKWVPLALLVLGALAFAVGASGEAGQHPYALFAGPILVLAAVLLASRRLVGLCRHGEGRGPAVLRFGVRDLVRRAKPSATLLAILSGALAVVWGLLFLDASADTKAKNTPPNLPPNMVTVESMYGYGSGMVDVKTSGRDIIKAAERARRVVPGTKVVPIEVALHPKTPIDRREFGSEHPVRESAVAWQKSAEPPYGRAPNSLWIATDALMSALVRGRGAGAAVDDRAVYSRSTDSLTLADSPGTDRTSAPAGRRGAETVRLETPNTHLISPVWIGRSVARDLGWRPTVAGALLVLPKAATISQERSMAAALPSGFRLVTNSPPDGSTISMGPVLSAVGVVILLLIAGVVLLEYREFRREASVLTAIGATPRFVRRTVAARFFVLMTMASVGGIAIGFAGWLASRLYSLEKSPLAFSPEMLVALFVLPVGVAGIAALFARDSGATPRHL